MIKLNIQMIELSNGTIDLVLATIAAVMLCWASATDIQRREIPVYLFGVASIVSVIIMMLAHSKIMLIEHILYAALMFVVFFIEAKFFGGGGGDAIMVAATAMLIGRPICWIVLSATTGVLLYMVLCKIWKKQPIKEIPVAPFILAGYIGYTFTHWFVT